MATSFIAESRIGSVGVCFFCEWSVNLQTPTIDLETSEEKEG